MQTKEQIQYLLQHQYSSTHWKAFLSELFATSHFYSNPTRLTSINASIASDAFHIGNITLSENGISRHIAVYEVVLAPNVVLERNRVGLRNLLKMHWKEQDAAFVVYYQSDRQQHSDAKKWRFSYVSELKKFNEAGEYVANNTEPKRYTYVLGEGESCRTAAERFYALQQKAHKTTLDDIKEAFSVEKLSKTFFTQYKDHYQDFVQYLTGKRQEKVAGKWEDITKHAPNAQLISVFNNNEKDVRDFCKKLLGRIVFLYFIQKKGWLGVPLHDSWGNGKPDFMSRLLANCANPAIFYSEYLSKLFFETLNQLRADDLAEIVEGEPTKIPYLNGGLFEEDDPKHRHLVFKTDLFKNLFDFFDQYNFTIYEDDPNDHTVAVDPEMLGHIFENLLEDNKDKGAFYTPKEIVHYMCQESLIEYLTTWFEGHGYTVQQDSFVSFDNHAQTSFISANDGRTGQGLLEIAQTSQQPAKHIDRAIIEKLLKKQLNEDDKQAVIQHAAAFNEALDKVKICDPAIGSGAFPMGLLQEIFTAKQTLHTFVHGDLASFAPAAVKLNIIQNSIYGVDIERGAVDIARLRFWLSLVVDEPAPQALPNLDYKIVVGNSLISKLGDDVIDIDWDIKPNNHGLFGVEEAKSIQTILKQITNLQSNFFNPNAPKKELAPKIRNLKIDLLIQQLHLMIASRGLATKPIGTGRALVAQTELYLQTEGWKQQAAALQALKAQPDKALAFFDWQLNFAEVMNKDVAENGIVGFDIVIGNPPYVSTKGTTEIMKSELQSAFGYSDDLYNHFIIKGIKLLKNQGVNTMITPDTYFTTLTKRNLREFLLANKIISIIHLGHDIFDSAMVSTAIILLQKNSELKNKKIHFIDLKGKKEIKNGVLYEISQEVYSNSINGSIFTPNLTNLKIHNKLSLIHKNLVDNYWKKISTSRAIEKNAISLSNYRNNLKYGDWTLIGLITEGGQGLATANNGKYVGVREGTKEALRISHTRVIKLNDINSKYKTNYVMPKNEIEIWQLFDDIKEKHGRDAFGQGYLFRIVPNSLIANILSVQEKEGGIINSSASFVPYDKGDKDGNRWYLPTPYFIDWSAENVTALKNDTRARFQGYTFYFREGFCWNNNLNENYLSIKCRLKSNGVHDVASMSMFTLSHNIPEYYMVTLINSKMLGLIYRNFINNTVNVQINDIKVFPMPVPNSQQLTTCNQLFEEAVLIQRQFFAEKINILERNKKMIDLQVKVDDFVFGLYEF